MIFFAFGGITDCGSASLKLKLKPKSFLTLIVMSCLNMIFTFSGFQQIYTNIGFRLKLGFKIRLFTRTMVFTLNLTSQKVINTDNSSIAWFTGKMIEVLKHCRLAPKTKCQTNNFFLIFLIFFRIYVVALI